MYNSSHICIYRHIQYISVLSIISHSITYKPYFGIRWWPHISIDNIYISYHLILASRKIERRQGACLSVMAISLSNEERQEVHKAFLEIDKARWRAPTKCWEVQEIYGIFVDLKLIRFLLVMYDGYVDKLGWRWIIAISWGVKKMKRLVQQKMWFLGETASFLWWFMKVRSGLTMASLLWGLMGMIITLEAWIAARTWAIFLWKFNEH